MKIANLGVSGVGSTPSHYVVGRFGVEKIEEVVLPNGTVTFVVTSKETITKFYGKHNFTVNYEKEK